MNISLDKKEGFYINADSEWAPEGWIATTLGALTHWASGGTPSKANSSYWNGSIPWISATSMNGKYICDSELKITEEAVRNGSKIAKKGTLLFLVRGSGLYNTISFGIATRDVAFNQDVKSFTAKDPRVSHEFLYYLLKGRLRKLRFLLEDTGIGAGKYDTERLKNLSITFPKCDKERAELLATFNSLDNKIELLNEQNETLEELAQTLFKRWFIDFNFPDENGNPYKGSNGKMIASELGEIPEGWKLGKLCEVCDIHDSKRVPLSKKQREQRKGKFPYYGATSIMDHVDDFLFDGVYLLLAEDGSVIKEDKTPFLQYVWGKFWVNNHAHVMSGKNGYSTEMLYLKFKKTNVSELITGAVQLKINQGNLMASDVVIPPIEIESDFTKISSQVFEKIRTNSQQIQTLTKFRDMLLPKLMKGEIRVTVES